VSTEPREDPGGRADDEPPRLKRHVSQADEMVSQNVMTTDLASNINRRLFELVAQGESLLKQFPEDHLIQFQQRAACVAWMLSAVNLLEVAMPAGSRYRTEATMGGEEALARIALIAAFDPRVLYNTSGVLLLPHEWPDSIVGVVRAIKAGEVYSQCGRSQW